MERSEIDHEAGSVRMKPARPTWHVINELDLAGLIAEHCRISALCHRLEACADALPNGASTSERADLCSALHDILARHGNGDAPRIAGLFTCDGVEPLSSTIIARIRDRHDANTLCAEDLIAALSPQGDLCDDALGYMLRGFFDECRAAIAFADLAILALGNTRLTAGARAVLIRDLSR